jgi:hypothetical protein
MDRVLQEALNVPLRRPARSLAAALGCVLLGVIASSATAQAQAKKPPVEAKPAGESLPDYGLTLDLSMLGNLPRVEGGDQQLKARWRGKFEGCDLDLQFVVLSRKEFGLDEPEDGTELILSNLQEGKLGGRENYRFAESKVLAGPFGLVGYASLGRGPIEQGTEVLGTRWVLSGLLEEQVWLVLLEAKPEPAEATAKKIEAFLAKGIVYGGKKLDPKWTDEEARARWQRDAPEGKKLEEIKRTQHYIVLTNASGGPKFAEKMEECYAAIKKMYPFEELPTFRLMPVFLFQTPDEYYDFMVKVTGNKREQAQKSKGHAWRDYYATWYEAPGDPVHIHEATHQIFANRLRLRGGGSWFQEGVAEYISSTKNDRNNAARKVKTGKHVPLAKLVESPSLLFSAKDDVSGESAASSQYDEAALLIEFLRESKFGKDGFEKFLHAVGRVRRNDVPAIESALQKVYATDLAGVEKAWTEYCKKR